MNPQEADRPYSLSAVQLDLQRRATEFGNAYREGAADWDRGDSYIDLQEFMPRARELGLTGITISAEFGGQDLTALDYAIAVEACTRAARTWVPGETLFMTAGPGPGIILASENESLKRELLPQLVEGSVTAGINITEPEAGSAMTDLSTRAVDEGDHLVVSGKKRHITGASLVDYLVTFCRIGDAVGAAGIGAVLIHRDATGVVYDRDPDWLGLRGVPHGEVTLDNVVVPKDHLLFDAGDFGRLMRAFNLERLHNAVTSLALAQIAFDATIEFVQERRQFGRPIVDFQGVQWQIADMHVDIEAARAVVYQAAAQAVAGKYPDVLAVSAAKLFANEMAVRVTRQAADLHGAIGYTRDTYVERVLRDALVMPVAGGTPNILRNSIAAALLKSHHFSQRSSL